MKLNLKNFVTVSSHYSCNDFFFFYDSIGARYFFLPRGEQIHPLTSSVSKSVEAEVGNQAIAHPPGFVSASMAMEPISYLRESVLGCCLVCV